jgi:hypothetical protein
MQFNSAHKEEFLPNILLAVQRKNNFEVGTQVDSPWDTSLLPRKRRDQSDAGNSHERPQ